MSLKNIPEDLSDILRKIRKGETSPEFRGVPWSLYSRWIEVIGHKGKKPSLLKTYRFTGDDIALLNRLKESMKLPEIDILRMALQKMESK